MVFSTRLLGVSLSFKSSDSKDKSDQEVLLTASKEQYEILTEVNCANPLLLPSEKERNTQGGEGGVTNVFAEFNTQIFSSDCEGNLRFYASYY